jgi:hypothetical protein
MVIRLNITTHKTLNRYLPLCLILVFSLGIVGPSSANARDSFASGPNSITAAAVSRTITRASVSSTGSEGDNSSGGPSLSADGRTVAFY